jgi:hypothetical protein
MSQTYGARVVIRLKDEFAKAVNDNGVHHMKDAALDPLKAVLSTEKADLHNQLRDFEYYVQSSEAHGITDTPMVNWTRDATQHPYTQDKYGKLFVVSVGGRKVFDRADADKLADAFKSLAGQGVVEAVKVDSMDPKRNPPVPKQYFKQP